jgi:hypothetical protein
MQEVQGALALQSGTNLEFAGEQPGFPLADDSVAAG